MEVPAAYCLVRAASVEEGDGGIDGQARHAVGVAHELLQEETDGKLVSVKSVWSWGLGISDGDFVMELVVFRCVCTCM